MIIDQNKINHVKSSMETYKIRLQKGAIVNSIINITLFASIKMPKLFDTYLIKLYKWIGTPQLIMIGYFNILLFNAKHNEYSLK